MARQLARAMLASTVQELQTFRTGNSKQGIREHW
jgi:hypothetical protein